MATHQLQPFTRLCAVPGGRDRAVDEPVEIVQDTSLDQQGMTGMMSGRFPLTHDYTDQSPGGEKDLASNISSQQYQLRLSTVRPWPKWDLAVSIASSHQMGD